MSGMLRICMSSMFVKIEPLDFPFLRYAQCAGGFHRVHKDQRSDEYRSANGRVANDLGDELVPAAAIEQAADHRACRVVTAGRRRRAELSRGEKPQTPGAPNAAEAVDRPRTAGIINAQVFQQVNTQYDHNTSDQADHDRAEWRYPVARTSDGHQAGQEAVDGCPAIPLLEARINKQE